MFMHNRSLLAYGVLLLTLALFAGTGPILKANAEVKRYVRYRSGDTTSYGLLEGNRIHQLTAAPYKEWKRTGKSHSLNDVQLLVPSEPTKVLAVALNFRSHLDQLENQQIPEELQLFYKTPSSLIAHGEAIVIPAGTTNTHYEAEMVIVMGKRASKVDLDDALDYVLGVTCGNDVSARDWQQEDLQWWRAKGADTFGPCGPVVVQGVDYDNLDMSLRLNGEVRHRQSTSEMVRGVAEIVSFTSQYVTLEPGDLIYCGAMGITERIKPGDVVEVELEHAGILKNPVE